MRVSGAQGFLPIGSRKPRGWSLLGRGPGPGTTLPPLSWGFFFFFFFSLSRPFLVSVSFGPAILFERACVVGYVDSLVAGVRHATVVCVVFVSQITGFFGPAILFE